MTLEEIEKLSVTEIKAMIYDEIVKAEMTQNNIKALNQILAKKSKPPSKAE